MQQRQDLVVGEGSRSSDHLHTHHNTFVPFSTTCPNTYTMHEKPKHGREEVAEPGWRNGQLTMHGLGTVHPAAATTTVSVPTKYGWPGRNDDTLESIVHHATCRRDEVNRGEEKMVGADVAASSAVERWRKRTRTRTRTGPESEYFCKKDESSNVTATFCVDSDATVTTWPSFEYSRSLKTSRTSDDDSASHGGIGASESREEDQETKVSQPPKRSRAAAIHNQSERRRRDRINEKMKALQKLVPNASKTDKASMLDEVIKYMKKLQAQVEMMSAPNMSQMMIQQQQFQMSLLARMGVEMGMRMGTGIRMLDVNRAAPPPSLPSLINSAALGNTPASAFLPQPLLVPPVAQSHILPSDTNATTAITSIPSTHPCSVFLAQQSMNMEFYNRMATLYQHQSEQTMQKLNHQADSPILGESKPPN